MVYPEVCQWWMKGIKNITTSPDKFWRQICWWCFTSYRQRGHLEMAPQFTVPCKGREARFLLYFHWESNPGCGVAVHYTAAAPRKPFRRWKDSVIDKCITNNKLRGPN